MLFRNTIDSIGGGKMNQLEQPFRVILVDDEPIILRSLKVAIPWEELNISIVGEARNGEQALAMVNELSPHMIISDIRMPGIDGITLMKRVLSDNPKRLFIFISGYGEFEYAREALREGAFDYLLKPIDHEELIEMIKRAKINLERQIENDHLLHSVNVLSMLAKERMIAEFIEGGAPSLQHLAWLENSELEQEYFMAVVQLDHYLKLNEEWTLEEKRLWLFAIRNILEEWSITHSGLTVFPFHTGEWILLFRGSHHKQKEALGADLVQQIKANTKLQCSIGFSLNVSGINQLSHAYASATKALYKRFYLGTEAVLIDQAVQHEAVLEQAEVKYPKKLENDILEAIRTLNQNGMLSLLDSFQAYIEKQSLSKVTAEGIIVRLTVVIYRQFEQLNLLLEWSLEGLLQELQSQGTLVEMMQVLKINFSKWINEGLTNHNKENVETVIAKAQDYIHNNYHKDLSMEEVAELIDLSISHFCMLFKQVSGYTFLEYLTKIRMDKAKYILKNSNVKVYQVAPLVGYQDPRYFTQVFKKITGMTPSEFREEAASVT
jgi:two-component system response regulator YesN